MAKGFVSKGAAKAVPEPSVERKCFNCAYGTSYRDTVYVDCNPDLPPILAQTGKLKVHQNYSCIFHKLKDNHNG